MSSEFMQKAIDLAIKNVTENKASPYGAVVVKDGRIIGTGTNDVNATNDPTNHAEIQAIRDACENLQTTDLSGCELYASGEPCIMCVAASYQARIKVIYYGYARDPKRGQWSNYLHEQLCLPKEQRDIQMIQLEIIDPQKNPYILWDNLQSQA